MMELSRDALVISFPEVHRDAVLRVDFQRTLRIPDGGRDYPLPPGLGRFPLRHVDDYAARIPERWRVHGGVMLPMYQAEALWLNFVSPRDYPFAVKVGTGKINAVTGDTWSDGLHRRPQDYLSIPEQPWLDGYRVERGVIRQFVAMPLGSGYSVEEQITGAAEHGGIQVVVYPLKASAWERRMADRSALFQRGVLHSKAPVHSALLPDMGLAPGGRMRQKIHVDPFSMDNWDLTHRSRCFVHLANSMVWRAITGDDPPTTPPTADEYNRAGLPWFEYYGSDSALPEAPGLAGIESVHQIGAKKGDVPLPENESVEIENVVEIVAKATRSRVREGTF